MTNILVPSIPKSLQITQGMIEDFLWDPVLAAKVLLGMDLDYFQRARLRLYWHVPFVMDSSGFSSGKTIVNWIYIQLRAMLMPGHSCGVYYPVFNTGKETFWPYYDKVRSRLFRAHLGRLDSDGDEDGKEKSRGSACYVAYFKNGSKVSMPAPSFLQGAMTQASLRFGTLLVDEWTHVETMGTGIDDQLIGRVTAETYNQDHPLWSTHLHFTAPAKTQGHPAHRRALEYDREVARGNPRYAHFHFSYKDFSQNIKKPGTNKSWAATHRIEQVIRNLKKTKSGAEWLAEGLGIWSRNSEGWYSENDMLRCVALGTERGVRPVLSRRADPVGEQSFYFLGGDPAPSQSPRNDDGGLAVLRARPCIAADAGFSDNPSDWQADAVWLKRVRRADASQWAGQIHHLHERFGFSKILLDWGGGGQWIKPELAKSKAVVNGVEKEVTPLITPDDMSTVRGSFILHFMRRRDPGIEKLFLEMAGDDVLVDKCHTEMRTAVQSGMIGWPKDYREWTQEELVNLGEEGIWSLRTLQASVAQFISIQIETKPDGGVVLTKNGARRFFAARGKKDMQTSVMMAWHAFLVWLKMDAAYDLKPSSASAPCDSF